MIFSALFFCWFLFCMDSAKMTGFAFLLRYTLRRGGKSMTWVYIDILFCVSWGMNTFLLWAAGRIVGLRTKKWRVVLGGLLSAAFYCVWLIYTGEQGKLLVSVVLLGLGIWAAYLPKTAKIFLRLFGGSILASFLLGGGIQVLFTLTKRQMGIRYPWYLLLWSVLISYFGLKAGAKWLEANIQRRKECCTVSVCWRGKQAEGRVLIDTGHGLKQEDGRGVLILELAAVLPLFLPGEGVRLLAGEWEKIEGLESLAFGSLGNADGRLWGFYADEGKLYFGEKEIIHKNIFVGISKDGFSGAYEGLTPPCLLEEEWE